jgi:hypothetical protein
MAGKVLKGRSQVNWEEDSQPQNLNDAMVPAGHAKYQRYYSEEKKIFQFVEEGQYSGDNFC